MPGRIQHRLKFLLERMLLRGAHYRLLVIAAFIGLLSVLGGGIVFAFATVPDVATFPEAVWWAFLRLTDPGYLGDDEGTLVRAVSTVLTVFGYVVFLGSLVAILTQWLNHTIRRLESGLTPIAARDHILVLGWASATPGLVRELVQAQARVRRFLKRSGARALRIVILADEVNAELHHELRERLGRLWNAQQVVLRSGTPLRLDHLRRVQYRDAAVIVLPAADPAPGIADADTRTIKTLLSIATHAGPDSGEELPLAVAEIVDDRKTLVAHSVYPGPLEILASGSILGRLVVQNVRHPGLSQVYAEILTYGRGNELYLRELPDHTGARLQDLTDLFPGAVLLGVVRTLNGGFRSLLNPPDGFRLDAHDRVALLARGFQQCEPAQGVQPVTLPREDPQETIGAKTARRILVLGWSHSAPPMLREFDQYENETFDIDLLSLSATEHREQLLERHDVRLTRVRVRHLVGDYTAPADLRRVEPAGYDAIVMLGTDRLESDEEADARTVMGFLLLREILGDRVRPHVVVELLDAGNAPLLRRRGGEVIVTPLVFSHMLAQVVLRRELSALFDELFGPGGAEIAFRRAAHLIEPGREVSFRDVQLAAAARGATALGIRTTEPGARPVLHLNPPRARRWTLGAADDIIVLTTDTEEDD